MEAVLGGGGGLEMGVAMLRERDRNKDGANLMQDFIESFSIIHQGASWVIQPYMT